IELWGEGFSYTDLMRLKKGVDRRGGGYEPKVIFNIPAGDDVLIFPIPQSAMDKNPNLIQNPEATAPQPVTE
ncbi:MAG: RagB/SusD family nutrient uptake outer membrane protein, partial [Bacteroidales bacterium]|nr:RagB/SusD family nutrient uptake outer membrane protein [Bacteroidales bacterium]